MTTLILYLESFKPVIIKNTELNCTLWPKVCQYIASVWVHKTTNNHNIKELDINGMTKNNQLNEYCNGAKSLELKWILCHLIQQEW